MKMLREPLTRDEVIQAIERKGCGRVPLVFHKWWGQGLEEKYGPALDEMASSYPDDIFAVFYTDPGATGSPLPNPHYRWGYREDYDQFAHHSIGSSVDLLPEWEELSAFLADFPDPDEPGNFDVVLEALPQAGNRYKLGCFWRLFHEWFWTIRGMENLMTDYYDAMDELKTLGKRRIQFLYRIVDRFAELGFDGIFTSDDLGHQTGPMMSPAIFEELYLPLYKDFIGHAHSRGMHVFLHSCGDNTKLMDMLIEAGLDVFHPIQAGTMDVAGTAAQFGDRISFLAGADVQHLIPEGTAEEVREGLQRMIKTLWKPEGGLLLAAGNGIMPDTPLENIRTMLEVFSHGMQA